MTRVALVVATVGGVGYIPVAPGTAGSALGVFLYLLTRSWSPVAQVALLAAVVVVGIWAGTSVARQFEQEDPGLVVVDELAGQLLTLFLLDVNLGGAAVGFLLFRVLDIVKPWPAHRMEALPDGLGIMADDLMAGAYGWLLLYGAIRLFPALQ
jgi:phosphatidylglycerophosphatase A